MFAEGEGMFVLRQASVLVTHTVYDLVEPTAGGEVYFLVVDGGLYNIPTEWMAIYLSYSWLTPSPSTQSLSYRTSFHNPRKLIRYGARGLVHIAPSK